jgi:hypothetical protein
MEATVASVGEMVQGQSAAQAHAQQQLEAQYQALLRQKEQQAQDERDKVRRQGVGWRGLIRGKEKGDLSSGTTLLQIGSAINMSGLQMMGGSDN